MCGGTESQWPCKTSLGPLYEDTDMVRGRKVVGFNENVLRTLLATLIHALALCVYYVTQRFVWAHQISQATPYKGKDCFWFKT